MHNTEEININKEEIDQKVIAFVPIRHDSQRLPGKNYKLLGGKPLYHFILTTLLTLEEITAVVIDTNSHIVRDGCSFYFKDFVENQKLIVLNRDPSLTDHQVSMNIMIDSLFKRNLPILSDSIKRPIILQTHVTNPFLKSSTIQDGITKYKNMLHNNTYDSLFAVSTWRTRLYDADNKPINHDPNNLIQTQDLKPIYEDNSCMYFFTQESFYNNKPMNRLGINPCIYPMTDKEELVDIDWLADLELAEAYLQRRKIREDLLSTSRDKNVLITGVAGGIGSATAKLFKKEGYFVYGIDLREPYGLNGGCDIFIKADLCSKDGITAIYDAIKADNKLDALINVAAMQDCTTFEDTTEEIWDSIQTCNLKTPYFLIQKLLPLLKECKGSIVNISSVHSLQTSASISSYAVSKAGLSGLTRSLAIELGKYGIRVNSISPGAIDTPMLREGLSRTLDNQTNNVSEALTNLSNKHLMGSVGKPEDIANAILFLVDNNKSSFITGTNLVIDGGATIRLSTE